MQPELRDLPEIEYLDGIAHRKVSPKTRHALVQAALVHILRSCAGTRGFAGSEWRFRLSAENEGTLLVPDAAFISTERLREVAPELRDEPPIAPDIAIEVRSPSDDLRYLEVKTGRYLEHGALAVLVADPKTRTLIAHSTFGERTFRDGERFVLESVPWLQSDVTEAFASMDAFERL